jgi:adenylate cyclase
MIGLTLSEAYADDETLPDVRVGLAYGPMLGREGDYFGATVNLAHRIVNIAYVGSVVAAPELHDVLEGDERFRWKALRPRRLKGIGSVPLWVLDHAGDDDGEWSSGPRAVIERARARRRRRQHSAGTEEGAGE